MKGQLGEGSFAAVSAARKNLQFLPFSCIARGRNGLQPHANGRIDAVA